MNQDDQGQDQDEDDDEEASVPVAQAVAPVKKQRKPTGGTGKKTKVFVEGKVSNSAPPPSATALTLDGREPFSVQNDLLALAASVSGDVAKKAQAKVEKAVGRQRGNPCMCMYIG